MVRPHVAVITTVEPVHLEYFPSVEAIAEAKAEILQGLVPGGTAVLPRDNPHFALLQGARRRHRRQDRQLRLCATRRTCAASRPTWKPRAPR